MAIIKTQGDPRQPQQVTPFYISAEMRAHSGDLLVDIYNFVALIGAVVGVVLRIRWSSWLSLFASILGYLHRRPLTADPSKNTTTMSSVSFAVMGLVSTYAPMVAQFLRKETVLNGN
ncbi:hypothetical protein IWQ60_008058 [Tieghemiomyces parasiticus]|uniref:Protein Asterix n=1 Tax=Tieghemiomyces parasiticus TaxID=78921 RepID=A0A9W7ZTZ2_9FUNG|nr:hypothetical protein IWQ60_008058 [Tieghemiomyces parasiticus]